MNILFVNYSFPNPFSGGTERVIANLSKFFSSNGINTYILFFEGDAGINESIIDFIKVNETTSHDSISTFIKKSNISTVIIFRKYIILKYLKIFKRENCFIIYSLRYSIDDSLLKSITLFNNPRKDRTITGIVKKCFASQYLKYVDIIDRKKISLMAENSDRIILQSNRLITLFAVKYKVKKVSKILSINNALSYDYYLDNTKLGYKDKIILLVARMEEKSKRVSLLLEIWKNIQAQNKIASWKLLIIGEGSDLSRYQDYVIKYQLKEVEFLGRQNPEVFYRKASIFTLTSSAEGFPMTLLEAQQMGCIPIAFNSFITLHDIIDNGINGYIIENNDIESYSNTLINLMNNDKLRFELALNAIQKSKIFCIEKIGQQWIEVFTNLAS